MQDLHIQVVVVMQRFQFVSFYTKHIIPEIEDVFSHMGDNTVHVNFFSRSPLYAVHLGSRAIFTACVPGKFTTSPIGRKDPFQCDCGIFVASSALLMRFTFFFSDRVNSNAVNIQTGFLSR